MEILIGLALSVALLYFWLIGHWFARVLVFLGLEAIALPCLFLACVEPGSGGKAFAGVGLFLLVAAWPIASIPIHYWQKEIQRLLYQDVSPTPPVDSTPHQLEWKAYAARH